jgi:hypothetical protein
MSDPALIFLPWVDRGGTVGLPPDRPDAHPPSRISTTAEVFVNETGPARVPVRLMGPGDVTALVQQQVIRTEPAPGTRVFESNYLAAVELDEPSLPWLFTPASAMAGKLRPWLCLVAVEIGPGIRLDPPAAGPLPVLRIGRPARPEVELPDLADSWAWAHAQVAPGAQAGSAGIAAALEGDPARNLARLVCGRLLSEQTEYLACVVPTFEAGRRAGLGLDAQEAEGPAWSLAPDMPPVELPVYYHWTFATGPTGDFQSLAMAIRGRQPAEGFGSRSIDLSTSGLGLSGTEDARAMLGGALQALGAEPVAWSDPALPARFATALTEVLNTPDLIPTATPVLAPPRYGAAYRSTPALAPDRSTSWYEQLNANPANRIAAALGVQIIQRDQETLVASAWDQAADMRAATALARLADAGVAVAQRMHARHLSPLAPESGVFVLTPLLRRLQIDQPASEAAITGLLDGSDLTANAFSPTVRRVTRSRGSAVRLASRGAAEPQRSNVAARMGTIAGPLRARLDVGELATFELLGTATASPISLAWGLIRPTSFTDAPPRPTFTVRRSLLGGGRVTPGDVGPVVSTPTRAQIVRTRTLLSGSAPRARPIDPDGPDFPDVPDPPPPPDPPDPQDSPQAAAFRLLAPRHLTKFLASGTPGTPTRGAFDVGVVFNRVIAMTAPVETFAIAMSGVLIGPTTDGSPSGGGGNPPQQPAIPRELAPRFGTPMATALAELGQEWLLPGLEGIPANTALALRTNSSFVQAFMIGLNHEFGRELLWREFPTPLNAMFFQRFWDNAIDPAAPVDLEPLAGGDTRALGQASAAGERFVLLLRSELLRRFPDAIVSAVRGSESRLPVFTGALVPDVRYFGFAIPEAEAAQWSVVIAEQPSAPRFGFEVGEAPPGVSHAPAPDPTSAALAQRLRQLPARITIPVPVLLRRETP